MLQTCTSWVPCVVREFKLVQGVLLNTLSLGMQINAASYAQMANSALKWNCHLPVHAKAQEQIQEALRQLPPEKHAEMLMVKEELDTVSREAAAADAAVAAVAKVSTIFKLPAFQQV